VTVSHQVQQCMGTVFSFDIREPGVSRSAVDMAIARLHQIDREFSTYRSDSAISRLNAGLDRLEDLSPEVQMVLAQCELWKVYTDGWFSATAGVTLDPSGDVKGWALQQVSDILSAAGSVRHSINGGGDILCRGDIGTGQPWTIGLIDPRDSSAILSTISGTDFAVATSGTAERGRHILDPHTGHPVADHLISLTVSGASIIECDVLATAGFAMGPGAHDWFVAHGDVSAFAIEATGGTWSTFKGSPVPG
jgi:thiamine biosynthesis lipoprotein